METGAKKPQLALSQSEFAKRRGVQKGTVSKWKGRGLLVLLPDGKVDVDATEWKLDQQPPVYRGGITHRPVKVETSNRKPPETKPKTPPAPARPDPIAAPSPDDAAVIDLSSGNLRMAEAVCRKENYLGLLRKHEFEVAQNAWVRVEDVGALVERDYGTVRERLLIIPGKLATRLVGLPQAEIELLLRQEVTEALNELHDPDDIAERIAAGDASAARAAGPEAAADPQPH